MPKSSLNVSLKGADDIFSTEESRQAEQREQVQQILVEELFPFKDHPFRVQDDEEMENAVKSISQYGVLTPLIARPRPDGDGYEIISGHRRQYATKLAGLDTLPVIVRQMSDDAAVILMVDSNLQREHILPSERALAYKMKLEAIKNQGARSDLTSAQVGRKLEAADIVGQEAGDSRNQVRRFIRLTNLIPELLDMVDEKKISFNPAVELSYLDESQQRAFLEAMDGTQNAPSVSQAQQLKKMAQCGEFTYEKAFDILGQTAAYSVEIWKRFRKWGGIPTGLTQNVKDLLSSREVENIFENSDMIIMLNQAAGDRQILAKQLNISPHQLSYVTHSGEGEGLLFFGNVILPFVDRFPTDLELYRIMTTKLGEVSEGAQK